MIKRYGNSILSDNHLLLRYVVLSNEELWQDLRKSLKDHVNSHTGMESLGLDPDEIIDCIGLAVSPDQELIFMKPSVYEPGFEYVRPAHDRDGSVFANGSFNKGLVSKLRWGYSHNYDQNPVVLVHPDQETWFIREAKEATGYKPKKI